MGDTPTTYIPDASFAPPRQERPEVGAASGRWEETTNTRDLPDLSFGPGIPGSLIVCDSNTTIRFPEGKTELVIGRRDPAGSFEPNVDLTEHGGAEKGVSRQHARISCREAQVYIQDLGSHNGTYVNQQRLHARQEQPLHDRDTIWLGHLKLVFAASKDPPA